MQIRQSMTAQIRKEKKGRRKENISATPQM